MYVIPNGKSHLPPGGQMSVHWL